MEFDSKLLRLCLYVFAANLHDIFDQRVHIDDIHSELKLPFDQSIKVEKVVDEPRLEPDVPRDSGNVFPQIRWNPRIRAQARDDDQRWLQRRAQFVAEHSKELIFGVAGSSHGLVESRFFDADCGLRCDTRKYALATLGEDSGLAAGKKERAD